MRIKQVKPSYSLGIEIPKVGFTTIKLKGLNLGEGDNEGGTPLGFELLRLPTEDEWESERLSWSSNGRQGAVNSPLRLPAAGRRLTNTGSLDSVGTVGFYWCATPIGTTAKKLRFITSNAIIHNVGRASGNSVRLIVDGTFTQQEFEDDYQNQTISLHGLTYGFCYNPATERIWLDRNLGATQVATYYWDVDARGWLYQWGRGTDGHQLRTSDTTTVLSNTDQPGHGDFITVNTSPGDWRDPQNEDLWQGVNGINNPKF